MSSPRRRRFRLDPDQRKWLKILIIVALFAYPMWLVGKQRCGWALAAGGSQVDLQAPLEPGDAGLSERPARPGADRSP